MHSFDLSKDAKRVGCGEDEGEQSDDFGIHKDVGLPLFSNILGMCADRVLAVLREKLPKQAAKLCLEKSNIR
jgi:hypothetical protein